MEIWAAFILGLAGSLHCAGMCGPLALAIPATGKSRTTYFLGRLAYNSGRVTTYCTLGAIFGLIGLTFALAGIQRWVSIVAGVVIISAVLGVSFGKFTSPATRGVSWIRGRLAGLLHRRTLGSTYLLGMLNGFLPCGLVYVACAGAIAAGGLLKGVECMVAFGLGTVPMMLSIGLVGKLLRLSFRIKLQRAIPICLVSMGLLLILRGMGLGIPYVSPILTSQPGTAHCLGCH